MNSAVVVTFICVASIRFGYSQDISDNSQKKDVSFLNFGSPSPKTPAIHNIRRRRMSFGSGLSFCLVPPQPSNGQWQLHPSFCDLGHDCHIPQQVALQSGSQLVYSCSPGFKAEGNTDVYCLAKGNWSPIPKCIEIRCAGLNSESKEASCVRFGEWFNCNSSVPPKTRAQVFCRPGYNKDTTFLLRQTENVVCNMNGTWEPDPIRCVPVCGVPVLPQTPLIVGGVSATSISNFPWHATLFMQMDPSDESSKEPICGATIIQTNRLLTSAHCIYDEKTKTTVDPGRLFVMTGTTARTYDSPLHNSAFVKKSSVKNVYTHCNYTGQASNYVADIALLELETPFVYSSILRPACLDLSNFDEQVLEPGAFGKIATFRKPKGKPNDIILAVTEPYISYSDCFYSARDAEEADLITKDKFCAGFRNETTLCEDNTGGGLMFKHKDLWYVMGILSKSFGDRNKSGEPTCNKDSYTLYTKVSTYIAWVVNVIFYLERNGSPPSCKPDLSLNGTTIEQPTPTVTSTNIQVSSNVGELPCTVPPQPENGEWKFRGYSCENRTDCALPQGAVLRPGSQLVYSCAPGYRASENTNVYCADNGNWSAIPVCIEVKCSPLNSVSTVVDCHYFNKPVSCDFPVPSGTQAEITCRPGYKRDAIFIATRREIVKCSEEGEWKPDPIKCIPVCGVPIPPQKPLSIGGTIANIGNFPWHATLYLQTRSFNGTSNNFICGATIIHANFLLTAAHCVYNERTRTTENPRNLFVMTGNTFLDYDSMWHNPDAVRKAAIKKVYKHLNYYAFLGNYVADIALLELERPFNFSNILLPACLDFEGNSEQILEPGVYGRVAGFGRTATGRFSGILQTLTLPYISFRTCRTSKNAHENEYFISTDKFCAGYTNGTALCDGDSGGGLVFQKTELWYVLGIVSVGLGTDTTDGERHCDKYSYTLFTKVHTYLGWIQNVISHSERYNSYQP